jgi:hypothetical protein
MTDLPASTWREIEKASVYLPGETSVGRFIGVGTLKTILKKSRRSLDQNSLIHVLFDETIKLGGEALGGWTRDDIKEWALGEYWGWDECKAFGRTRLKPKKRSSRMNKQEASDFIEWYVRTMAGHGIVLRLPGEQAA